MPAKKVNAKSNTQTKKKSTKKRSLAEINDEQLVKTRSPAKRRKIDSYEPPIYKDGKVFPPQDVDDNSHNKNKKEEKEVETDAAKHLLIKDVHPWNPDAKILMTARIIHKSAITEIKQKKFFSLVLMDEVQQLIKMDFWEEQASRFKHLKEESVIQIRNPLVKQTNKQYQVYHKYTLVCQRDTDISMFKTKFPEKKWLFTPIIELLKHDDNKLVDVQAVIVQKFEPEDMTSNRGMRTCSSN